MVICLERGADLHMAQRIPLPLTVSCFSKMQIGFIFLVPAHPGIVPDKGPLNGCVCVNHFPCQCSQLFKANWLHWQDVVCAAWYVCRQQQQQQYTVAAAVAIAYLLT